MFSAYNLLTISKYDLITFKDNPEKGRVGVILNLIYDEMPLNLKKYARFITPYLIPIEGFEDQNVKGYELNIVGNKKIESFVRKYIPFFILRK